MKIKIGHAYIDITDSRTKISIMDAYLMKYYPKFMWSRSIWRISIVVIGIDDPCKTLLTHELMCISNGYNPKSEKDIPIKAEINQQDVIPAPVSLDPDGEYYL